MRGTETDASGPVVSKARRPGCLLGETTASDTTGVTDCAGIEKPMIVDLGSELPFDVGDDEPESLSSDAHDFLTGGVCTSPITGALGEVVESSKHKVDVSSSSEESFVVSASSGIEVDGDVLLDNGEPGVGVSVAEEQVEVDAVAEERRDSVTLDDERLESLAGASTTVVIWIWGA